MQGELIVVRPNFIKQPHMDEVAFDTSNNLGNQLVPDGPNVKVIDRAFYLLEALDDFAKASGVDGYHTITKQNENGNKFKIKKLQDSAKQHMHDGRIAFLRANNLNPYLENSIETQIQIAESIVCAEKFKEVYTGPGSDDRRDKLRKRLFSQIEFLNSLE